MFAGTGWFFYERLVNEQAIYMLTGNRMGRELWANTSLRGTLTMRPIKMVKEPFIRLRKDDLRQYFWEYYIRSMFFGESLHREELRSLGSAIMLLALVLAPVFLYGLLRDIRRDWYAHFPMLMTLFWLFAAQITRRAISPFSPSQDFRLTMLTIVPILFYTIIGMEHLPRFLQKCVAGVTYSLAIGSAAFILLVASI